MAIGPITKRTAWRCGAAGWLSLLLMSAGCDALGYLGYLFAPPSRPIKVQAEYSGLANRTTAIVIFADQSVQYEYPYARVGLSMALSAELKKHVKGITVVDPQRVIKYQDENVRWDSQDKSRLGRALDADMVLYVVLREYQMREPGSINLFRGRITAQATVYETADGTDDERKWYNDDLRVVYPEDAPTGKPGEDDTRIRYETEKRFAQLLAKKFYDHEVKEEE